MYIEKPFLSNPAVVAQRNAVVIGLRDLAELIEERQLTVDPWTRPQVNVYFEERSALFAELTTIFDHDMPEAASIYAVLYNSTFTVTIPVAAVQSHAEGALEPVVTLQFTLRTNHDNAIKLHSGYYAVHPYDGSTKESYTMRFDEENTDSLEAFFAAHGIEVHHQQTQFTQAYLDKELARAQEYAATKVAERLAEEEQERQMVLLAEDDADLVRDDA